MNVDANKCSNSKGKLGLLFTIALMGIHLFCLRV